MKRPCNNCIVFPMCTTICQEMAIYGKDIEHRLNKHRRHVFSKNGRRRKNFKDIHRKHWNSLVKEWNSYVSDYNTLFERFHNDVTRITVP